MRPLPRVIFSSLWLACGLSTTAASSAAAQQAPTPAKHKPKPNGSPLDTIMSSHLWTSVPQARDFVRDSRPAHKDMTYTPLTSQLGKDPDRPKPRDPANVLALQAELEQSIAHNNARSKGVRPAAIPHKRGRRSSDAQ